MEASKVADTFRKEVSVTVRYQREDGQLVAKEVRAGGKEGEGAPQAQYRAEQKGKKVTLFAEGMNPTGGWNNALEALSLPRSPPEFKFIQTRPRGFVTQVITPFSVKVTADAPNQIDHVFVTDATGTHKIPVQQVP